MNRSSYCAFCKMYQNKFRRLVVALANVETLESIDLSDNGT